MKPAFMDLMVYDTFEVHPVVALDYEGDVIPKGSERVPVSNFEQCEEDEVDIYMWSVYGHIPHTVEPGNFPLKNDKGGVFCLLDCSNENTARFVARLFEEEREIQRAKAWNKKK